MIYKSIKLPNDVNFENEINDWVDTGWNFVQIVPMPDGNFTLLISRTEPKDYEWTDIPPHPFVTKEKGSL